MRKWQLSSSVGSEEKPKMAHKPHAESPRHTEPGLAGPFDAYVRRSLPFCASVLTTSDLVLRDLVLRDPARIPNARRAL